MQVSVDKPFELIYSLNLFSPVGPVIEPFVVQLNAHGAPTLSAQRVHESTIGSFYEALQERDTTLIQLMDEYSHQALAKRFGKRKNRPAEFLQAELTDEYQQQVIRPFIDKRLIQVLAYIQEAYGWLYLNSKTGNPTSATVTVSPQPASVHFHFIKQNTGTKYYPTIRHKELGGVKLASEDAHLITGKPCWVLVNGLLFQFTDDLDGKKLKPFLKRPSLHIPERSEPEFYQKFIPQVIERHYVEASGFAIRKKEAQPTPVLSLTRDLESRPAFMLTFNYGDDFSFYAHEHRLQQVNLYREQQRYEFYKVRRDVTAEGAIGDQLAMMGLSNYQGSYFALKAENAGNGQPYRPVTDNSAAFEALLAWLRDHKAELDALSFEVHQEVTEGTFYLGRPELSMDVRENPQSNDWFDIQARVYFGDYSVPFLWLKPYIQQGIREYPLPSGEVALIPEAWFTQYADLFQFLEPTEDAETTHLRKHHYRLLSDRHEKQPTSGRYIRALKGMEDAENAQKPLPASLNVKLRDYQAEGYSWLMFLRDQGFGGCLADDMGLGKTLQTLTTILKDKEEAEALPPANREQGHQGRMNLIIMPASLLHNWKAEILKFAPQLSCLTYTGNDRSERIRWFEHYDMILTTYGLARNDVKLLERYQFNYIILDESQVIKNPSSKSAKAVKQLHGRYRLVLTGTPIENSLMDLWSQMAFLNPGLLGSYRFFKQEYGVPIEKNKDEQKRNKLRVLIKPFLLRRTKEEISEELPSLTEKTHYCIMSDGQQEEYDRIKSYYRNQILDNIEHFGIRQSQFMILKGLTQLRLAANHPGLVNDTYQQEAAKFEEIIQKVEDLSANNHKILVFSQFVRHLNFLRASFEEKGLGYAMLTGSSRHREDIIEDFRNDSQKPVFLISLKAGGVGLNLVEADYVFVCDPWWNPATESQAINRAHRIGQDKSVIAYKFITKGTIEEKILQLQERKSALVRDVIQANQRLAYQLTQEDLEMLLN